MNPINVTGYDRAERAAWAAEEFHQRPGGHRKMKIRHVTGANGTVYLVRSHTDAGARRFVLTKLGQDLIAKVATQEQLVDALQNGVAIEDATNNPQASIPEPDQSKEPQE